MLTNDVEEVYVEGKVINKSGFNVNPDSLIEVKKLSTKWVSRGAHKLLKALDENNIGRFIKLLEDFKAESQFVVITHNPRTIEAADWIYGVTMEEPGISTVVGVKLEDALQNAETSSTT